MSPSGPFFDGFYLNFDLFSVDGKPLEFSLDGYGQREFMRFATIVEAFGGKLSNHHALNTIVFSHPNYISKLSCTRYNIKFLEDSIKAQQLQNLENYRITSFEGWKLNSCVLQNAPGNRTLERDPKIGLSQMCMGSFGSENNEDQSSQNESDQGASVTKQHERILKDCSVPFARILHKPQSAPVQQEHDAKSIIHSVNNNDTHEVVKVKPKIISISSVKKNYEKVFLVVEPSKDYQNKLRMNNDPSREEITEIATSAPNDVRESPRSIDFEASHMENEHTETLLLNSDLMNNKQKLQSCDSSIDDTKCDKTGERVSKFLDSCQHESRFNISDEKIMSDAESCNERYAHDQYQELKNSAITSSSNPMGAANAVENESADKLSKMTARNDDDNDNDDSDDNCEHDDNDDNNDSDDSHGKHDSHNNDDDHDHHQHESLIDETTHTAARVCIAKRKTPKKVNNLKHFEVPIIINCTDDPKTNQKKSAFFDSTEKRVSTMNTQISKSTITDDVSSSSTTSSVHKLKPNCTQCKTKRPRSLKQKGTLWSEEEDQVIINYLIENNAIQPRMRHAIWGKCLEASPLLQESRRTISGIQGHFYHYLRHHYDKYTNDPEALRRFELTKPPRPVKKIDHSITNKHSRRRKSTLSNNIKVPRVMDTNLERKILKSDRAEEKMDMSDDCDNEIHFSSSEEMELSEAEQCDDNDGNESFFNEIPHTAARIRMHKKKGSRGSHSAKNKEATPNPLVLRKTKRQLVKRSRKYNYYTEEENRRMIQYLINSNKIHMAHLKDTWQSYLAAAEGVNGPKRTTNGLTEHCEKRLMKKFKKYTDDPIALEQFAKHASRKRRAWRLYSEDEDRFIINYLINNRLIHRATSRLIWKRADLHGQPIFQKLNRSPQSLRNRFSRYLRYNYAKYTNNPEALEKFKKMEIKLPPFGNLYQDLQE